MTKDITKLTSTTETTAWIPRDVYAGLVIEAAQANRLLAGLHGAVEDTVEQGQGNSKLVRFFPSRTAQGPIAEGASLSYASSTPTTVRITLGKYGDADKLTGESIEQTSDNLKARLFGAMGRGLARKFDTEAYAKLIGASGGDVSVATLVTKGDLTTNSDFAMKLGDVITAMRKKDVIPDVAFMGPDQIAALGAIKQTDLQVGAAIRVDANGVVTGYKGVRIVDLLSIANANANTVNLVQAVVLDSSRAFGELYGRDASFEERRIPLSDEWEEVVWAQYGCELLDKKGIGLVKNAAV